MSAQTLEELFAPDVDSIDAGEPASHAKRRMDTNETRSLLVFDGDRLVGIIRRNSLLKESTQSLERPVSEFMEADVPKVNRSQSVEEAHNALNHDINTEQLPVLDEEGRVVGVINRNSLTGAMEPMGGSTADDTTPVARLPIEEGMSVKDADGSNLGSVAEADFKVDGGVEYLIVEHGLIFKKQKRLPGDVVDRIEDGDLHLAITSIEFGMINDIGDE